MTDNLVFSVNQYGEIQSLDAAEREAAAVLAAIRESKLTRANTQIPMSVSIALADSFQIDWLTYLAEPPIENLSVNLRLYDSPIAKSWALHFSPVPSGCATVVISSSP